MFNTLERQRIQRETDIFNFCVFLVVLVIIYKLPEFYSNIIIFSWYCIILACVCKLIKNGA